MMSLIPTNRVYTQQEIDNAYKYVAKSFNTTITIDIDYGEDGLNKIYRASYQRGQDYWKMDNGKYYKFLYTHGN